MGCKSHPGEWGGWGSLTILQSDVPWIPVSSFLLSFFFFFPRQTFQQSVSAFTMNVVIRVKMFFRTLLFISAPRLSFLLSWPSGFYSRMKSAAFVILVRSCLEAHISGSGLEWSFVKVNLTAEIWWLANGFWARFVPLQTPKTFRPCVHAVPEHNMRCAVLIFLTQRWALWQMDCMQCGTMLAVHHTQACACRRIAVGHVHIYRNSQREMSGDREVITGPVVMNCKECFSSMSTKAIANKGQSEYWSLYKEKLSWQRLVDTSYHTND